MHHKHSTGTFGRILETTMTKLSERFRGFLPVIVDIETGGVDPEKHAMLELAIVLLNWEAGYLSPGTVHFWAVQPHETLELDSSSLGINRIDPFDPNRKAIEESEVLRSCFRIVRKATKNNDCSRAILTAHNAHFDRSFLTVASRRHEIKRDPFHLFSVLDTVALGALAYGHTVLEEVCNRAGIAFDKENAHSARYDAEVTAKLFCVIVNEANYLYSEKD